MDIESTKFKSWKYMRGLGVVGELENGEIISAGNIYLMKQNNITIPEVKIEGLSQSGCSYLLISENNTLSGIIILMDSIRPEASESVALLTKMGVEVAVVTGDNELVARNVAHQLNIKQENVFSQVTPEGKAELIKTQWKDKSVAMVGDGVNDVVGLAAATTSVAMGGGTAEAADITMTREDLRTIPNLILLSRKSILNIKQNLFLSFVYNIVSIPVAAYGLLNPMIAAAAMSASSLCVVTNSLRLKNVKLFPLSSLPSSKKSDEHVVDIKP